jgi:hypothetical protein
LNKEDIKDLNRSIMSNDIEAIIKKNSPTQNSPGLNRFTAKFCQTFKELTPMLLKSFCKIERKLTLANALYRANITLISKVNTDTTKKDSVGQFLL